LGLIPFVFGGFAAFLLKKILEDRGLWPCHIQNPTMGMRSIQDLMA
jgi:hypothetical protein